MAGTIEITNKNIKDCLKFLAGALNNINGVQESFYKESLNGVPLIIVNFRGKYYSVCYFLKHKNFKIYEDPKPYYRGNRSGQKEIFANSGKHVFRFFKELGE